ncbi:DUF1963 domain-containing protein [Deinococcus hopiensis]|uniref:DUF1963 domain-containing protein n=1 Tax=Deinococcus hopiensis KR-140 TaxID=695939 RepID=A0A1W1UBB2_9DEIO|nr:DUF1963 domain-containing protein [Deinococcus hopiensis]SMB78074.1 protein of unknown function [Deinococcus hopiensis KR-140]
MKIVFRYDELLEAMRERLRALPRDSEQLTDRVIDTIAQGLRHGWLVNYRDEPRADEDFPIGASKFGGRPDVPPGWTWPTSESGRPMGFLLQVDMADIDVTWQGYPADGLLSLYWEPGGDGRIHYAPAGSVLERFMEDMTERTVEADCQLIYAPAAMQLREARWLPPFYDVDAAIHRNGERIPDMEFYDQLHHPDTEAHYERCREVLGTPDEEQLWDWYHDGFLLFGNGSLSHLSSMQFLTDWTEWRLIFDIFFMDRPQFAECYTDHNICQQMMVRVSDLQALDFQRLEMGGGGEG